MSTDRYRITLEREPDASWSAELVTLDEHDVPALGMMGGTAHSSSPGEVLERIGQHLDELEAKRLDAEHGFAPTVADVPPHLRGAISPERWAGLAGAQPLERLPNGEVRPVSAEDLEVYGDAARVLEVLEDAGGPVPQSSLAQITGLELGRVRRALEHAQADDVVELVRAAADGDDVWALDRPTPDVPY